MCFFVFISFWSSYVFESHPFVVHISGLFLLQEIFYGRPSDHLDKSVHNHTSKDLVKLWDGYYLSF